jgi:hypothetical protein
MTRQEFTQQIDRLRTQWTHGFGSEKEMALYEKLHAWPRELLEKAVTDLLLNHKGYAPGVSDLEDALIRMNNGRGLGGAEAKSSCGLCNGAGATVKMGQGIYGAIEFAVPCSCDAGRRFAERMGMKPVEKAVAPPARAHLSAKERQSGEREE